MLIFYCSAPKIQIFYLCWGHAPQYFRIFRTSFRYFYFSDTVFSAPKVTFFIQFAYYIWPLWSIWSLFHRKNNCQSIWRQSEDNYGNISALYWNDCRLTNMTFWGKGVSLLDRSFWTLGLLLHKNDENSQTILRQSEKIGRNSQTKDNVGVTRQQQKETARNSKGYIPRHFEVSWITLK